MPSMHKPTKPERLYVDFDGFFASCEEQADPCLYGKGAFRFRVAFGEVRLATWDEMDLDAGV